MCKLQLGLGIVALLLLLPAGPVQAQAQAGRGACKTDVEKLCKDVKPGEGAIATCLKQNEASVSPGCKEAMAQAHAKMQALTEACASDAQQYCKDVKRGHGRVLRCLKDNEAKLSEGCRAAMQSAHGEGGQK
jgi:Cysteine rich repeat